MGGSSTQKHQRTVIIILAFIVLRTFFALIWDIRIVSAGRTCPPYPDKVFAQLGVRAVGQVACKSPDGIYATVGHKPDSFIILDMGEGNEVNDQAGIDFTFYSRLDNDSLAPVEISVAPGIDKGLGDFIVVFIWEGGPNNAQIGIDIANASEITPETLYRYVRIQPLPSENQSSNENVVNVDAVE